MPVAVAVRKPAYRQSDLPEPAEASSAQAPANPVLAQLSASDLGFAFGPQQDKAMTAVSAWFAAPGARKIFRLFGYAGTGKTTLARHLAAGVKGRVCFAAYTAKAALMLEKAGCEGAQTIHSLIYKVKTMADGSARFVLDRSSPLAGSALLVIDECSMVDEDVALDLLSFGVPILVLGDPAQLPPVKGAGYFTNAKPDAMLTEIHRQAKDNAIIRIATDIREGRKIDYGTWDTVSIIKRGILGIDDITAADQVLVGRNDTRRAFNAKIRKHIGATSVYPRVGDRLVCLRNDNEAGILNGGLYRVTKMGDTSRKNIIPMQVESEDFPGQASASVGVRNEFFDGNTDEIDFRQKRDTQWMDYGYALTGHKSQGSQWRHVIAYDESGIFGADGRRWLYTVATRASERLTLVR